MATLIQTKQGAGYLTNHTIPETKGMIDRGEVIVVWWFAIHGQRYTEEILIEAEEVAYLRTESDD